VCGICASASVSAETARQTVNRLNGAQHHRGPDGAASVLIGDTCLGNTRLAIIAPGHNGDQPLLAPDGSCTAVFNGEIYNHRELIEKYQLRHGGSDGAVIPQLYARFGKDAFRLLRGMFAIILADHKTGQLVLVRDQLGIKPLHWRIADQELQVSSEVRPLMRSSDCLDPSALARFLHLGSLSTTSSPFTQIQAVAPNTWLSFSGNRPIESGPVDTGAELARSDEQSVAEAVRETVELHLRSDVPAALLLSSGVDSSALAWGARQVGKQLHCLTVELGGGRAEADQAARTAAWFGHTHQVVRRTPGAADVLDFFYAMQRPSVDGLNTFVVSRAVQAAGFKVALSGAGGDEATGGYSHFRYLLLLRGLTATDRVAPARAAVSALGRVGRARFPPKAQELLAPHGPRDAWGLSLLQRRVWPRNVATAALGLNSDVDLVQEIPTGVGRRDAPGLTAAEYRVYLQSTLLPDADAFSMASSVELRVPLVDRHVIGATLAAGGRTGLGKKGFALSLADPRVAQLAGLPKQGFALPIDEWMRHGLLQPHVAALSDPQAPVWGHVDLTVGRSVLASWERGGSPWSHAWCLVVLDQWLRSLAPGSPSSTTLRTS